MVEGLGLGLSVMYTCVSLSGSPTPRLSSCSTRRWTFEFQV